MTSPSEPSSAAALRALLLALLTEDELRRLLRDRFGPELAHDLLTVGTPAAIFEHAVALLERRGLIDPDLFEQLGFIAPGRHAEISAVARRWGLALPIRRTRRPPRGGLVDTRGSGSHTTPRAVLPSQLANKGSPPGAETPMIVGFTVYRYTLIPLEPGDAVRVAFSFDGRRQVDVSGFLRLAPGERFVLSSNLEHLHVDSTALFLRVTGPEFLRAGDCFMVGSLRMCLDDVALLSYEHQGALRRISVPSEGLVLGRDCGLPGFAEEPLISRRHARIDTQRSDGALLTDLGSTNGTFIGRSGEFPLHHGAQFVLSTGDRFRVEITALR